MNLFHLRTGSKIPFGNETHAHGKKSTAHMHALFKRRIRGTGANKGGKNGNRGTWIGQQGNKEVLYMEKLLRAANFTHRGFNTRTFLHTDAFTHENNYTQKFWHKEIGTHRRLYTWKFLHTVASTHTKELHTGFGYTGAPLHKAISTHRNSYTQTLCTQTPWHTKVLTQISFYPQAPLHKKKLGKCFLWARNVWDFFVFPDIFWKFNMCVWSKCAIMFTSRKPDPEKNTGYLQNALLQNCRYWFNVAKSKKKIQSKICHHDTVECFDRKCKIAVAKLRSYRSKVEYLSCYFWQEFRNRNILPWSLERGYSR